MRILGDLTENEEKQKKANAAAMNAPIDRRSVDPKSLDQRSIVGEMPLNDAPHVRTAVETGNNGGTGRSHGRRLTAEHQEGSRAQEPRRPRSGGLWFAVVVLALALAGVTGYGYLVVRNNGLTLAQLPGIGQAVTALGGRMDATEAKLRDLTANWTAVADRVSKLDRKFTAGLAVTRKQTQALVAQAEGRLRSEMEGRNQVVDARLTRVETAQTEDRARIAQMDDQLHQDVAGLRAQVTGQQQDTRRDLAGLQQQADQSRTNLDSLAQQMTRQRVNFEAAKNATVELAPGVSLTVLKTNVSYQRFNGYLSLTDDGRTLWLPNVSAQQSVAFYSQNTTHPWDLVVTRVSKRGVVGYLLLPAGSRQG